MQSFTGIEYLKIDIANQFGLDKLTWDKRLWWTEDNRGHYNELEATAKSPVLYRKAIRALERVEKGEPTNHTMGLDATASGVQLMACMSGCHKSAAKVNLINTGEREDLYQDIANDMSKITGTNITKDIIKKPVMTFFYGSTAQPRKVFGEGKGLKAFYAAMAEKLKKKAVLWQPISYILSMVGYAEKWSSVVMHRIYG
jgi:DNA-directed RNA polymerase